MLVVPGSMAINWLEEFYEGSRYQDCNVIPIKTCSQSIEQQSEFEPAEPWVRYGLQLTLKTKEENFFHLAI
jgi:hypothetical protein